MTALPTPHRPLLPIYNRWANIPGGLGPSAQAGGCPVRAHDRAAKVLGGTRRDWCRACMPLLSLLSPLPPPVSSTSCLLSLFLSLLLSTLFHCSHPPIICCPSHCPSYHLFSLPISPCIAPSIAPPVYFSPPINLSVLTSSPLRPPLPFPSGSCSTAVFCLKQYTYIYRVRVL